MLKRFTSPPTLVIAGAWNPDILSPSWIAKEAMGLTLGLDFPVSVQLPIGNPTQRPTFEFEKIKYFPAKARLTFYLSPDDKAQIDSTIRTATRILELLSHTPVTGFGLNFFHEIENPGVPLRKTFSCSDISVLLDDTEAQTVVQNWGSSVKMKSGLLGLTAKSEGNSVFLEFNVHHEVDSAAIAAKMLGTTDLYESVERLTLDIAQKLDELEEGTI